MSSSGKGAVPKKRKNQPILISKMMRTPPKKAKNQNVSTYLCQICIVEDDIEKVRCDDCTLWYHFTCANVTKDMLNQETWMCSSCVSKHSGIGASNIVIATEHPSVIEVSDLVDIETDNPLGQVPVPPNTNQNVEQQQVVNRTIPLTASKSNKSHKSMSTTSSMGRRQLLALQKLEEERKLLEQRELEAQERQRNRDRDYIAQKYSILDEDALSNLSLDDEQLVRERLDSTRHWAENIEPREALVHKFSEEILEVFADRHIGTTEDGVDANQRSVDNVVISSSNQVGQCGNQRMVSDGEIFAKTSQIVTSTMPQSQQVNKKAHPRLYHSVGLPDWLMYPRTTVKPLLHPWEKTLQSQTGTQPHTTSSQSHPVVRTSLPNVSSVHQNSQTTTSGCESQQLTTVVSSSSRPNLSGNGPTSHQQIGSNQLHKISEQLIASDHQNNNVKNYANYQSPALNHQDMSSTFTLGSSHQQQSSSHAPQVQIAVSSCGGAATNWNSNCSMAQPMSSINNIGSSMSQQPTMGSMFTSNSQQNVLHNQMLWSGYSIPANTSMSQMNAQPNSHSVNQTHFNQAFVSNVQPVVSMNQNQPSSQNNHFIPNSQPYGSTFQNQPPSQNNNFNPYSQLYGSTFQNQRLSLNNNFIPHNQPASVYQSMPMNNGMNLSYGNASFGAMANVSIPSRLTAEQIASRHVMPRELPHFDGNPNQWEAFISAFENSTETCGFSNSENLGRLQKCLKGDAYTAVRSRLLHKDSVPGVIHTLRMMYGRPEFIIETMIRDIQKTPAPKDDDLSSLIKFAISVQNLSATIQNTGAFEHLRNPMLINSITDKLPAHLQLNWAFHKNTIGNVTIADLGNWLYQLADVASQVVRLPSKSSHKKQDQKDSSNNNSNSSKGQSNQNSSKTNPFLNTQVENMSMTNDSKNDKTRNCPACNNSSCTRLANCKKFKDSSRAERWTIVKDNFLCGRCFGRHKFYRCSSESKCTVEGCNSNHHTLLHNYDTSSEVQPTGVTKSTGGDKSNGRKKSSQSKPVTVQESNAAGSDKKTCNSQRSTIAQRTDKFRIVPVMLHFKNKSVRDYAYLDDGSNMTTMEDSLANELELTGSPKELCVDWAFGNTHATVNSRIVSVGISGYYENAPRYKMDNVRTVKHLHLPTQSITTSWIDQYPHFKNIPIATYDSVKPRLLIGLQYSKLTVSMETIEGRENEPMVCKTRLGWVVQGPTFESDDQANKQTFSINMCECQSNDKELHQLVKDYFALENLGVKIPEKMLESKELQRANQILEATTIKKDNRYESGLLWKYDDVELPDSYDMALKRLKCLEAKMAKNPDLRANLFTQIKQFVEKGYIRRLSSNEITNCKHRVWYLPTFPVFNPKKPEKVRLVWDGAAKVKNTSLNSNLLVGPDQLVPLPELLRRFRERAVAVTGDIEEMYHQVKVQESDQHVQRFLWREDPSKEPDVYVMLVMTFGSKCSPSVAQYVKNKNASEFQDEFPQAAESIIQNHYVDDMIDCTHSEYEAEKLIKEVKMIHLSGGFNIRNFSSNSNNLLRRIGESTTQRSKNLNIDNKLGTERVLGMFWDTSTDSFTFSLKFTKVNEELASSKYCPTKREVLQILMSVFDPLGLLANFLIYAKILLQEIWRSQIEWDEKLPAQIHAKWTHWIKALLNVENLRIPRLYSTKLSPKVPKSIQLHTFVDASIEACAAVTYLRIEDEEGVDCCLVGAKTKVAPNKPMSVPRLELQAAVLGTRLAENIKASQRLTFEKQVFWSDSKTVMGWINSEVRQYNQFVSFRIGEILESTDPNQWRWVPSKQNVADEATKSKEIPVLSNDSRWFKAPKFLYDEENTWFNEDIDFATEEELRPCFVMSFKEIHREQLIELERFSQWNRLVRTHSYVLRFVHNAKNSKQNRRTGPLIQEELINSENCLYQRAQRDCFFDEILVLKHNETVSLAERKQFDKSSELRTLSPYLDENNVLRMRGRIDSATVISHDTKRPIILPRRHQITKLLVDHYHRQYKHLNHQTALNEIRQRYVIPALRVVMKQIRTSCQKCKNSKAMPRIPEMAELPPARLAAFTRPFTYTGVDYFGPYYVKVNRSVVPRYGVLFTCLTTRAIHLEVADSLNTSSCINATRRFSTHKGKAREFFSDNGTNFHGADNELKKEFEKLNQDRIQQEFTSTEQKWTFNPPTASHMGGVWERLIKTVKSCLNQMLATKTPTQEMLVTLMAEVENIVNSRPLTYISLDSVEDEALTPNHFLFGSSNALTPIAQTTPQDLHRNDWRAIQEMTKHFWRRFVLEYMPTLTKRTKWFKQVEPIKVGDVVLVIDERNSRNTWPKGIVEELVMGRGGCIRHVMVRFEKRVLPRPVSKLAILDVKPPNQDDEVKLDPMEPVNGGKDVAQH